MKIRDTAIVTKSTEIDQVAESHQIAERIYGLINSIQDKNPSEINEVMEALGNITKDNKETVTSALIKFFEDDRQDIDIKYKFTEAFSKLSENNLVTIAFNEKVGELFFRVLREIYKHPSSSPVPKSEPQNILNGSGKRLSTEQAYNFLKNLNDNQHN